MTHRTAFVVLSAAAIMAAFLPASAGGQPSSPAGLGRRLRLNAVEPVCCGESGRSWQLLPMLAR